MKTVIWTMILLFFVLLQASAEEIEIGTTQIVNQSTGSVGSFFSISENYYHFVWVKQVGNSPVIYYNRYNMYYDNVVWPGGIPITEDEYGINPYLSNVLFEDATLSYQSDTRPYSRFARGSEYFDKENLPDTTSDGFPLSHPKIAMSDYNEYHAIQFEADKVEGELRGMYYSSREYGDDEWSVPELIDSINNYNAIIIADSSSYKMAIVYPRQRDQYVDPIYDNDLYLVENERSGWDWDNKINITSYNDDDTVRIYNEVCAYYGYYGFQVFWVAPGFWNHSGEHSTDKCFLYHWNENIEPEIIVNGWQEANPGPGKRTISNIVIGQLAYFTTEQDPDGCIFNMYSMNDVDSEGYSNADILITYRGWEGEWEWRLYYIISTNSNNCQPGECMSEIVLGGSIPGWANYTTYQPLVYIHDTKAEPEVERSIYFIPEYWYSTSIDENQDLIPHQSELRLSAYPNPFNSSTTIKYSILGNDISQKQKTTISIYNLAGQHIDTIVDELKTNGEYQVKWEASESPSGLYFCRIQYGELTKSSKLLLLK